MNGIKKYWLTLLLLTSVDTIIFGTNINKTILFVPRILGLISIIAFPIIKSGTLNKFFLKTKDLWAVFIMFVIMSISSVINSESFVTYISKTISVLLAYSICQFYSKKEFACIFDDFMTLVSCFAVSIELMAYIIPSLLRKLPTVTNTASGTFYTCFFGSIQSGNLYNQYIRANGVFWEPGAFAIYLVFAMMIQLFVLDKINIKRVIIYFILIVFTFSTTGYVTLGVLLLTFIISDRTAEMSNGLKTLFILLILGFTGFMFYSDNTIIYDGVIGKLTSGTSSATTRYSSIFNGIKVIFDHPLFGVASRSQDFMYDYVHSSENKYTNGGTIIANTIIGWSVNFGLVFGSLFVVGTLKYLKKYAHSIIEWILLSIVIIMAYSGERFFSFFPFIYVFYGLKKGNECNENSGD